MIESCSASCLDSEDYDCGMFLMESSSARCLAIEGYDCGVLLIGSSSTRCLDSEGYDRGALSMDSSSTRYLVSGDYDCGAVMMDSSSTTWQEPCLIRLAMMDAMAAKSSLVLAVHLTSMQSIRHSACSSFHGLLIWDFSCFPDESDDRMFRRFVPFNFWKPRGRMSRAFLQHRVDGCYVPCFTYCNG